MKHIKSFGWASLVMVFALSSLFIFRWVNAKETDTVAKVFNEGEHYRKVANSIETKLPDPNQVLVQEFFWFGCPACYSFEGPVGKWQSNISENVVFEKQALATNKNWQLHARLYYYLKVKFSQDAAKRDELVADIFKEIHQNKNRLSDYKSIGVYLKSKGLIEDIEQSTKELNAFAVDSQFKRSQNISNEYGVAGVPTFIVGGKYEVVNRAAKSYDDIFDAVNYLVDKVRAEQLEANKDSR